MTDIIYPDKLKELAIGEHDSITTPTKKVLAFGWDVGTLSKRRLAVNADGRLQVDVLSGGGGGVQYTEGSIVSSIIGTAMLWEDAGDIVRAVSVARPLPVNVVAGGAGGGIAQTQVRNAVNVWTDVGFASGNLNMPIGTSQLPSALTAGGNLRVAVLEGGAGGGLAQTQVRNLANVWTDVGFAAGNLNMPAVLRTEAGVVYDARQIRALTGSDVVDISDKAARLLGIIYGNQGQLAQRATTLDALVQLRHAGAEIDPRVIRALTSADIVSAAQSGAWSVGVNNFPATYDVSDRATRLAGITSGDVGQILQRPVSRDLLVQLRTATIEYDARQIRALTSSDVVDISDRAARLLGRTNIAGFDVSLPAGINNIGDVDVLTLPSLPAGANTIGNVNTLHGKSIKNATGTITTTTTIVAAVVGRKIKVTAISLITSSATAVVCTFRDGAAGTARWVVPLQALAGTISGVNLATQRPDCLFETTTGNLLELALSAAASVTYSISFFDDDAI